MSTRSYTRAVRMWTQQFPVGTDLCAEIAACIDEAVAAERASVVAWLRAEVRKMPEVSNKPAWFHVADLADIIERGEHRREEEP